jgi:hypothetical protein
MVVLLECLCNVYTLLQFGKIGHPNIPYFSQIFEIFGDRHCSKLKFIFIMDKITIKSNPKFCLYWCLIEFIDWRSSQPCWYFRPSL